MSAILLSNPFVTQMPQASAPTETGTIVTNIVTPAKGSSASGNTGNSTQNPDRGENPFADKARRAIARQAVLDNAPPARPADASPKSVVTAQLAMTLGTRKQNAAQPTDPGALANSPSAPRALKLVKVPLQSPFGPGPHGKGVAPLYQPLPLKAMHLYDTNHSAALAPGLFGWEVQLA